METLLLISSILLWVIVLFNLLLTLVIVRRITASQPTNSFPLAQSLPVGETAPSFTAQTLDGQTKTLASYAGRPVLLTFIAPTCQSCRELLVTLEGREAQARQQGTELVLVCDGDQEQAQKLVTQKSFPFSILLVPRENNPFFTDYRVQGTPFYCLLNEQGKIEATGYPGQYDLAWKKLLDTWTREHVP